MSKKIKSILIDLSGTLHIDDTAIPGAVDALKRLRKSNTVIKFVTNTTKESKNTLHKRLIKLGFDIKKEEIFSSLAAAREVVKTRKLNPLLLIDDAAIEDFEDLVKSETSQNAVLVGLAPEKFNYKYLNDAFRLLLDGAPLIAIHEGRFYKRPDGLALGPGAFVKGLEYSSNVKAEVVGKPTSEFFIAALDSTMPEEAIMIGDDVKDDIAGAQAVGIKGFLVKTGKYREGDEKTINPTPTNVCDSFTQAVDLILKEFV
ncbi:haloacid dehalogenase-like hydrolase domain-containing protein 2 [Nasonia vitripennis]|uniref:Haloacid dehalogenase-like hydrolase domain-containing protein 2 n=1 Tax=Nasonia vitripennis TaxID=7425 RepID=A0A7M7Q8B9_NASVI|nr:haloacid dehalogenase-like hydrolase domain-containing protein 2 [Nasonia vitripennis]XP_031781491.1 haloacid dehalogenase-like hydrolase domain-containing protein 2 [Nasonia vitripennis]XP_032457637.1 haloacid dehalogenase-like hydrolase domain-containing protein 2 [Nasonia vitripennis]